MGLVVLIVVLTKKKRVSSSTSLPLAPLRQDENAPGKSSIKASTSKVAFASGCVIHDLQPKYAVRSQSPNFTCSVYLSVIKLSLSGQREWVLWSNLKLQSVLKGKI